MFEIIDSSRFPLHHVVLIPKTFSEDMPSIPGHQRNVSQGQHLIVDRTESDEEDVEKTCRAAAAAAAHDSIQMEHDDAPYGNGGVYPGSSPPFTPSRPQDNKSTGLCSPQVRSNVKVICGSIILTAVGAVLLVIGCWVAMSPEDAHSGMQHWVFFFAGLVCFIPGFYHVYYVTCTLCGRPGYSFDKLPTFNR